MRFNLSTGANIWNAHERTRHQFKNTRRKTQHDLYASSKWGRADPSCRLSLSLTLQISWEVRADFSLYQASSNKPPLEPLKRFNRGSNKMAWIFYVVTVLCVWGGGVFIFSAAVPSCEAPSSSKLLVGSLPWCQEGWSDSHELHFFHDNTQSKPCQEQQLLLAPHLY